MKLLVTELYGCIRNEDKIKEHRRLRGWTASITTCERVRERERGREMERDRVRNREKERETERERELAREIVIER